MTTNKALFLAGVCGALTLFAGVAEMLTGYHPFALVSIIALVPGIGLLIAGYAQVWQEWRANRSARHRLRDLPPIDFQNFQQYLDDVELPNLTPSNQTEGMSDE